MRTCPTSAKSLLLVLALTSVPAVAQGSTPSSPQQQQPAAAPSQAPSQSTSPQAAPQTMPGQTEGQSGRIQSQGQTEEENPLNLTEEQKAKLRPILIEENQKMEALRNDSSMTQEQKIAKAAEIRQSAGPKIRAILTPEQLQKLSDLQQKAKEQARPNAPAEPPQK